MKNLRILCLCISLFYSCKKDEEPKDNFTINGIHDISFGSQTSDTLSFSVDLLPGAVSEMIDLQIEGLPDDLKATLSKTSGKPTFNSLLTIERQESSIGTHYAQLIAIAPNGKRKAYPIKVVVPALRDMRFDGNYYGIFEAVNDSANQAIFIRAAQQANLYLYLPSGLPNTTGTYTYRITAASPLAGEAQLALAVGERYFTPGYNNTTKISLDLDSTGTITKVYLPDIEISTNTEPVLYRTLGINYSK
ncbi:MAG: hypothetical protein JNL13_08475 [Chitinophagaceae bacterium]|nr:hypothetical protein [Chitinophagaceae bacterium]